MSAEKKTKYNSMLRALVPLDTLPSASFTEVVDKAVIEDISSKKSLFQAGETDAQFVYLLEGTLDLLVDNKVIETLEAGSGAARYPISPKQPRQQTARAKTRVLVARIDTSLLDVLSSCASGNGYEVEDIESHDADDWMSRLLNTEIFRRLPPPNIQKVLTRLQPLEVKAGQEVICQGAEGDFFYIVKKGRCEVRRSPKDDKPPEMLAELSVGDSFGEEALLADAKRNANVVMVTDGSLMRLSKQDFAELLQDSLVAEVGHEQAERLIDAGARWLDVREEGAFEQGAVPGSINLPLLDLRGRARELNRDGQYVICCDKGRRSAAAAYVLSQLGFAVCVLKGGLEANPGVGANLACPVVVELEVDTEPDATPKTPDPDRPDPEIELQLALAETTALDAKLHALRSDYDTKLASGSRRIKQLEQELSGAHERLERRGSEFSQAQQKLQDLQQEVRTQIESAKEHQQQLNSTNAQLEENLHQENVRGSEMQNTLQGMEDRERELIEQGKLQLQTIETLEQTLTVLREKAAQEQKTWDSERAEMDKGNGEAQQSLLGTQEQVVSLQERAARVEDERDVARADADRQRNSMEELRQELSSAEASSGDEVLVLREQVHDLQQHNESLKEENKSLTEQGELQRTQWGESIQSMREQAAAEARAFEEKLQQSESLQKEAEAQLQQRQEMLHKSLSDEQKQATTEQYEKEIAQLGERLSAARQEIDANQQYLDLQRDKHKTTLAELSVRRDQESIFRIEIDTIQKREIQAVAKLRDELADARDQLAKLVQEKEQEKDNSHAPLEPATSLFDENPATKDSEQRLQQAVAQGNVLRTEVEDLRVSLQRVKQSAQQRETELQQEIENLEVSSEIEIKKVLQRLEDQENKAAAHDAVDTEEKEITPDAETETVLKEPEEIAENAAPVNVSTSAEKRAGPGSVLLVWFRRLCTRPLPSSKIVIPVLLLLAVSVLLISSQDTSEAPAQLESKVGSSNPGSETTVVADEQVQASLPETSVAEGGDDSGEENLRTLFDTARQQFANLKDTFTKVSPQAGDQSIAVTSVEPGPVGSEQVKESVTATATVPGQTRVSRGREFRDRLGNGGIGPVMVEVHGGSFHMGSSASSLHFSERPQHTVSVKRFAIGKYEVSFAEYDRFTKTVSRVRANDRDWGRGNQAVMNVSWKDAVAYTEWLSTQTGHRYRLPSEAEWEYSARAGTVTEHWWGRGKADANCFDCRSTWGGVKVAPVGRFHSNPFGLHDTAGNVEEWVQDCYHPNYQDAPVVAKAWDTPNCNERVVRGGSYASPVSSVRSARRSHRAAASQLDTVGFRVVREL